MAVERCPMPDDFFNRPVGRIRVWRSRLTGEWQIERCERDTAGIPAWFLCAARDSHEDAMKAADWLYGYVGV